jgi:hypothetical protein
MSLQITHPAIASVLLCWLLGWQQSKPLLQQVTLASVLVIWGEASCITSKDVSTEKRTIHYILLMPIRTC